MMRKKIIASCLSASALMLLPLTTPAAGLGKLSVKSALGQPLNAEIELLADDKDELAALSARLAGNDAFRDARIDPAAVLSSLKFTVDKKTDGRAVLKITSTKLINDPFLDMLIELDWATGRMVREYTVLLDPPGAAAIQTALPPLGVTQAASSRNEAAETSPSAAESKPAPAAQPPAASQAVPARKPASGAEPAALDNAEQTYGPVRRGDTLTAIANQTKTEGVNLEQMLVGLYRENRTAFVDDNMNRLKTGQILKLPSQEQAAAISAAEATRVIKLQSADWQSYRQKLAGEVVSTSAAPEKSAQAIGKITPKVEDKAALAQSGKDLLTLSKGEAPATGKLPTTGKTAVAAQDAKQAADVQDKLSALQEDAAAKQKALQDANNRVAALEKNIQDMQRLLDLKNQALAELQKNAGANPSATAAAGVMPVPAAPANETTQPAAAPEPVEPAPANEGGRWYDGISPLYLGGVALVLLLVALLTLMMQGKRRRKGLSNFEDSIMAATDLKANTMYGTQGGAAVNTNNTSFLTDFSQAGLGSIDTHDVDPIAEAEVYMAYGRDAQAEEILKEALLKNPGRHEIHLKLLEIYAARNNLPVFESVATELYAGLGGEVTPVWVKAAELGRKLDPNNPLYGDSGDTTLPSAARPPASAGRSDAVVAAAGMATVALAARRQADAGEADHAQAASETWHDEATLDFSHPAAAAAATQDAHDSDNPFDISLDFTAPEEQGIIADAVEKHAAHEESVFDELDSMLEHDTPANTLAQDNELPLPDFDFTARHPESSAATTPSEPTHADDDNGLDFDFDLPEADVPLTASDTAPALDFSDISLDLNDIGDMSQSAGEHDEAWQEVTTKLDLARVYQEMGDRQNAREILQEVMQEGNPAQKEDAQMLLAQLG